MGEGIATIIAAVITALGTIIFFIVQKRLNARRDKQDVLETSSNTIGNLLESISTMDGRYMELSKEIGKVKRESEAQLEDERKKRRQLAEKVDELESERDKLAKEVKEIKDSFKEERRKLLAVIKDLIAQMKKAGVTPDTTLLDAIGVSMDNNNKI